MPFPFSPGKKQWKQAATLNGRPYVVGHVPQSPSYQEVEFEGLLHGTTSTKVISLTKNPRVQSTITNAPSVETALPPIPPVPPLKKSSSAGPLKAPQSELHPSPKSDDHLDSMSPSVKKLFRLPATPGSNRKSMMIPAEYSTVEFETRMASYSDEEHNGNLHEPEDVKQKRRESRDDAWVDILIGSQSRRRSEQDAEIVDRRRGHHSKHSDPDIASLEVAQVLANIHNRTPSPPSVTVVDRVDRDYGMDHHVRDLDVDEVETIPRMSSVDPSTGSDESEAVLAYNEPDGGDVDSLEPPSEPILSSRHMARYQRRIGYFDLHPDRRQALAQSSLHEDDDDELRAKLAEDSDDDDIDDDRVYGPPEGIRPLPVPPVPPVQQVQPRVLEPSSVINSVSTPKPPSETKEKLPFTLPDTHNNNVAAIAPSTPSKTATLIEMYRERERGSPLNTAPPPAPIIIAPLAPSRLPVRSVSLPKEDAPLPQPSLLSTSSPKVSSPPKPSSPESTRSDPPRIQLEETGRSSPARYVHGAPLHNVLEEEEE